MLIENPYGIAVGDSEDPELIAFPREGIPEIIDTQSALEQTAEDLSASSLPVAVDVERAQGFRYGSSPYLLQLRREDVGSFLIDTAALPHLECLQASMNSTWILHDASQDLPNLRELGLEIPALFDTQVASRLLGMTHFGLSAVCEQVLGLTLVKDHQASNWSVRPLPKDWLRYAVLDVELLTALKDSLEERLDDLGRISWAQQEFSHIAEAAPPSPKKDRWRSISGIGKLTSKRALAIARELWIERDAIAREIDLAPGRLVRNSGIIHAAQRPPRTRHNLLSIAEFRSPQARRYAQRFLDAVSRALALPDNQLPPRHRTEDDGHTPSVRHWQRIHAEAHELLLEVREAVAKQAETLEISPEIVLEPRVQRALAWEHTQQGLGMSVDDFLSAQGARPWQISLMAAPLTDLLSR